MLLRSRWPLTLPFSAVCLLQLATATPGATRFVAKDNPAAEAPYTNWLTAAASIQDAVDVAEPGDTVLVTNGFYDTGGVAGYPAGALLTNRVAISKPITVRSINGPDTTWIVGHADPSSSSDGRGDAAVRGVYIVSGATLVGFTITNGHTRSAETVIRADIDGGGVYGERETTVSNCVATANAARLGGGVAGASLVVNSRLVGNVAFGGGGGASCHFVDCAIEGNRARIGGGTFHGELERCRIRWNRAERGGGLYGGEAYSCVVSGNAVAGSTALGGGVMWCELYGCTVAGNSVAADPGAAVGGVTWCILRDCIVRHNTGDAFPNWDPADPNTRFYASCVTPLPTGLSDGGGNIDAPPLFADTNGWSDLRLAPGSPCVDAGTNMAWMVAGLDLDGQPRVMNGRVDMGAYETLAAWRPWIVTQPVGRVVPQGADIVLSVAAGGAAPLGYEWRKDGIAVPLASEAQFTITASQPADSGDYTCLVSNSVGRVTSAVATVLVAVPPTILADPLSLTVIVGESATFECGADGTAPLHFQWTLNGAAVAGATGSVYAIDEAQSADAGAYRCRVSNIVGVVTSAVAVLTVNIPPRISRVPISRTVFPGDPAVFLVEAQGTAPLAYAWSLDDSLLVDATNARLAIAAVTVSDLGAYRCAVSNVAGSIVSQPAWLRFHPPPVITSQPSSRIVIEGNGMSFSLTATGVGPLYYQWMKDGAPMTGAGSPSYPILSATPADAGDYRCVVSNRTGGVTSDVARLDVRVPVRIDGQPQSLTVNSGQPAAFTVVASGTAPLTYQWQRDGAPLPGATQDVVRVPVATPADEGDYRCLVSNIVGAVLSRAARLTVRVPPSITAEPGSRSAWPGSEATFSVGVSGTAPFSFQWSRDGSPVAGGTGAVLAVTATPGTAGAYACVVTNLAGAVTSRVARLTLRQSIVFADPGRQSVTGTLALAASASSGLPVEFAVLGGPAVVGAANVLRFTGSGVATVRARQPGNVTWDPAPSVDRPFLVVPVILYAAPGGGHVPPFDSWRGAATNIQAAVDLAFPGGTVRVGEGTHRAAGSAWPGGGSRVGASVVIDKTISVIGVEGPARTRIVGRVAAGPDALRGAYVGNGAMLAGVTLSNGYAWAGSPIPAERDGGGVWCEEGGLLSNCLITASSAYCGGGVLGGELVDCRLAGNVAVEGGGACSSVLYRCAIDGNVATMGGGVQDGDLEDCTLTGNRAMWGGASRGGVLRRCELAGNRAEGANVVPAGGGALGGTLYDCVLSNNAAFMGGGAAYATLHRSRLEGNTAPWGGGVYDSTLYSCLLVGNVAVGGGSGAGGGACQSRVHNGTVVGNRAVLGGGLFGGEAYSSIVVGNTATEGGNGYGGLLRFCCTTPLPTGAADGGGNMEGPPRFVAEGGWRDLRLAAGSPGLDAGINEAWMAAALDLDGYPRIGNGRVDMGAYESGRGPWDGGVPLGGGWVRLDWFGLYNTSSWPWIYHLQHGWMYPSAPQPDGAWLYTLDRGWLWTGRSVYPNLYWMNGGGWMYYLRGSAAPRWFYEWKRGAWTAW